MQLIEDRGSRGFEEEEREREQQSTQREKHSGTHFQGCCSHSVGVISSVSYSLQLGSASFSWKFLLNNC